MLDRSAMEPHPREPGGLEAAARRGQGHVHRRRRRPRRPRRCGSSTGATPAKNDYLAVTPVLGRRAAAQAALRHRLLRQRHPAGAARVQGSHKTVEHAYDENLRDYRDTIPQLFSPNAFVILSNGSETKVGATFAPWERFGDWKRIDDEAEPGRRRARDGDPRHCASRRGCSTWSRTSSPTSSGPAGSSRSLARNHQVLGVNAAIEALRRSARTREKRLGVFWHTQGSGKSLSMLWFTQKVLRREPGNWTFVMVTDRTELDDQLHGEFEDAGACPRGAGPGRHRRRTCASCSARTTATCSR